MKPLVPARHEGFSFVPQVFVRLEAGRAEEDALVRRPKYEGALHDDVVGTPRRSGDRGSDRPRFPGGRSPARRRRASMNSRLNRMDWASVESSRIGLLCVHRRWRPAWPSADRHRRCRMVRVTIRRSGDELVGKVEASQRVHRRHLERVMQSEIRELCPGHAQRAWSCRRLAGHGRACDAYRQRLPRRPT